jgi:hypothetical protein
MSIKMHGCDGLEKWDQERIVHKLINDTTGLVELGEMWRRRATREGE